MNRKEHKRSAKIIMKVDLAMSSIKPKQNSVGSFLLSSVCISLYNDEFDLFLRYILSF